MFGLGLSELAIVALIPMLGLPELLVILLIIVVIFGASKLPQLGRGLGEGISNFRKGLKDKDGDRERIDEGGSVPPE